MNYKTLESPYKVTINEHEHILHIQRSYMYTCIHVHLLGRPLLVWTVWTYSMCIYNACGIHAFSSDRLPLCQRHRYAYTITPLSLVTDPLCYINLTFVKRLFAKLYNVNLLGTFVGLAYCIQARFSHVKSKNIQMTT